MRPQRCPPLWPGSTTTTLPSRMPTPVGANRAGPPAAGSIGAEAGLLPGAGAAAGLPAISRRPARWLGELPVRCGAVLRRKNSAGQACTADDPVLQAQRSTARVGSVLAIRRIRSPCLNRSAACGRGAIVFHAPRKTFLAVVAAWRNSGRLRNHRPGWGSIRTRFPRSPRQASRRPPASPHHPPPGWVAGHIGTMGPASSPNDPVFFPHHSNIDRLWAIWPRKYPSAAPHQPDVPTDGTFALNQQMTFTQALVLGSQRRARNSNRPPDLHELGGAEGIRTPDPLDANEVRYRTALQPREPELA